MERCVTAVEIREALEDLPGDLDMTYERILLDIDITQRGGKVARRALDWLIAALRPLQLSEIMEGVSIDPEQRTMERDSGPLHGSALLDVLGALVMYDEVTDIVLLSHFSVKVCLMPQLSSILHSWAHIGIPDSGNYLHQVSDIPYRRARFSHADCSPLHVLHWCPSSMWPEIHRV